MSCVITYPGAKVMRLAFLSVTHDMHQYRCHCHAWPPTMPSTLGPKGHGPWLAVMPNHDRHDQPMKVSMHLDIDDHGLVMKVAEDEDEDEDGQSSSEPHHGHDDNHDLVVTHYYDCNQSHGLVVKPFDVQLQDCQDHHDCDDGHGLPIMTPEKLK